MLRSMYSGISGMRNFQTKLDVIGNNIANVNTFGFKKGRVVFKDMISQTSSGATGPSDVTNRGGMNPKQVGLGSQLAAIDTISTQGNMQNTGSLLDLGISGEGYFVVGGPDGDNRNFTRAGNFYLDNAGDLVNSDGLYLISTDGTKITIPPEAKDLTIGKDGTVSYLDDTNAPQVIATIELAKFSNPGGLQKVGGNLYINTPNSGEPDYGNRETLGAIETGVLEMSNVDLSEEFTEMIVAQRGFQANTRIITTSDEILQELVNLKR